MEKITQRITMTLMDVYKAMRAAGIPSSPERISAGIASGAYPFGSVVNVGETGRRTILIYRVDFEAWLETKIPKREKPLQFVSRTG